MLLLKVLMHNHSTYARARRRLKYSPLFDFDPKLEHRNAAQLDQISPFLRTPKMTQPKQCQNISQVELLNIKMV
jgi:hypothetical protein